MLLVQAAPLPTIDAEQAIPDERHPLPLPLSQVPGNLRGWPPSCRRLHLEVNKCEAGMRSCDQHLVDRLRRRCARDEPHD